MKNQYTIKGLLDDIVELKFEKNSLHRLLDDKIEKNKSLMISLAKQNDIIIPLNENYSRATHNFKRISLMLELAKRENNKLNSIIIKLLEEKYLNDKKNIKSKG